MKKVVLILVLAMAIPACIFAGDSIFGLSAGVVAAYQKAGAVDALAEGDLDAFKDISPDDFKFGADVDVKVLFLDVNGKAFLAKDEDSNTIINGITSVNLAIDIAIVRLKAGLGYEFTYNPDSSTFSFGNGASGVDSFESFEDACLDVHVGVDVMLGGVIVGVYATLPTSVSIGQGNWTDLISTVQDNWKAAQFGLGVRFALL